MARRSIPTRLYRKIADSISDYGSIVDNKINLSEAAKSLGVTVGAVREVFTRERAKMSATIFGGLTQQMSRAGAAFPTPTVDVSGTAATDRESLRAQLLAAYGPGKRSAINTAAAAKDLGYTKRTIDRWIAPEGRQRISHPRPDALAAVAKRARQASTTKAGRVAAMQRVRDSKQGKGLANYGGKLAIDAVQGPLNYERSRLITLDLAPDQVQAMWSAYENGGDKGLLGWLNGRGQDYLGGWSFKQVDDLDLRP
ncbi:terminal protein [Antrihabitans spumae]|uniref:Terminal protein n=1 Tax=Antrihabitans spumae TaxID=3373370 RepID=A0ABW7JUN1_9NOCA